MIPLPLVTPDDKRPVNAGFAQVMLNNLTGQRSLHATRFFDAGDIICTFSAGTVQTEASYLTVQTGIDQHITLQPEFLQYINHSCDPNVFFNTTSLELEALKAIQPGDELMFFYPSTEWNMAQPFDCYCGSNQCLHQIRGAAHLTDVEWQPYRLTDFIRQQLQKRKK